MKALRLAVACTLGIGLLGIGPPGPLLGYTSSSTAVERRYETQFLDLPSAAGALDTANEIAAHPHRAGGSADYDLAVYMRDRMRSFGIEADLETLTKRVDSPIKLALELIVDPKYVPTQSATQRTHGTAPIAFDLREVPEPSDPATSDPAVGLPYHSGAADGDITAPLVFVNRGLPGDYETLENAHVDVRGAIALIRYGAQFRGLLAERAQEHGARGVILYNDPKDDGFARGPVYPNGPWRPTTSIQRGWVGENVRIPTLPISAVNAQVLLEHVTGSTGPSGWGGALPVAYPVGRGAYVHMVVKYDRSIKTLWNTIGRIRGTTAEQSVILGAHRDAWVAGVADNGAGVMTMLEVARGLGYMSKGGWKPKRTIIIAGWDGEEIGLVGSNAYVHRHAAELRAGCIAYLNADENVTGPAFGADAAAAIAPLLISVSHDILDPASNTITMYDRWLAQSRVKTPNVSVPTIASPGGGSDHEHFLFDAGIPVANLGFDGPFGPYHSSYDTLKYATTFSDPGFALHRTIAQIYGTLALRIADADVVPYTFGGYVEVLHMGYLTLAARAQRDRLDIDLPALKAAIDRFALAARGADARVAAASFTNYASALTAVQALDSLAYGANGYQSAAFPALMHALDSRSTPQVNGALLGAVAAIAVATNALVR